MSADPIVAAGDFYPGDVDATIEAIAQAIRDADEELPEWTERNVVVIGPEEQEPQITAKVKRAVALGKGLCLLVVGGESAENVEPEAETPRPRIDIELQLYAARSGTRRERQAVRPLMLCAALAKFLHHKEIRIQSIGCWDEITWRSWAPMDDEDYLAYAIQFDREMQL